MMRRVLVVALLTLACTLEGQTPATAPTRAAAAPNVAAIHAYLLEQLYSGLPLTKEQEARVRAIIDESLNAQDSVKTDPRRIEKRATIMTQRNVALRAVLKTEEERLKFDANLRRIRPS